MSVFPSPRLEPLVTITPFSLESLGSASVADGISIDAGVSSAWPSNNYAIFYPFSLSRRITVQSLFCMNGATAAGHRHGYLYHGRNANRFGRIDRPIRHQRNPSSYHYPDATEPRFLLFGHSGKQHLDHHLRPFGIQQYIRAFYGHGRNG